MTEDSPSSSNLKFDQLKIDAWNQNLQAFGKAFIFDKRSLKFSKYNSLLKFFGILTPVLVGAAAIGYGIDSDILKIAVAVAIPLLFFQLLASVLAVIFKWDEELAYSIEASMDYNGLSALFEKIAKYPSPEFDSAQYKLDLLNEKYQSRTQQDSKHSVKEWENRMGMRYALRERRRECVGCGLAPLSMDSTDCDICGKFESDFKKGWKKWIRKLRV